VGTQFEVIFFAASTHSRKILTSHLPSSTTVVKSLSVTRWSARADATKAFSQGYRNIYAALEDLQHDLKQQAATRVEALAYTPSTENMSA